MADNDIAGSPEETTRTSAGTMVTRRALREAETAARLEAERAARRAPVRTSTSSATAPAVRAPKARRHSPTRRGVLSTAIMALVVPGIFATVALPAYAFSSTEGIGNDSARASLIASGAQSLGLPLEEPIAAREGYSATTEEELEQQRAAAAAEAAAAAAAAAAASSSSGSYTSASRSASYISYTASAQRAEGDDYPWPYEATDDMGGGFSPLRYYYRECVDFVAWRMNRDIGSTSAPFALTWGNGLPNSSAYAWASKWQYGTSNTPVAGAVAWWSYNHVAYVQAVTGDGMVVLEEYNWNSSHAYHTRTVPASSVELFLLPPR